MGRASGLTLAQPDAGEGCISGGRIRERVRVPLVTSGLAKEPKIRPSSLRFSCSTLQPLTDAALPCASLSLSLSPLTHSPHLPPGCSLLRLSLTWSPLDTSLSRIHSYPCTTTACRLTSPVALAAHSPLHHRHGPRLIARCVRNDRPTF